jgi:hypothetical protein
VINAGGIEQRRPAAQAVDQVTLAEEQFGEIGAILACDARY